MSGVTHGEGLRHRGVRRRRHLGVAVHRVEALVGSRVVLVAAAGRGVDVAHQGRVTRTQSTGCQRLVELFFLFAVLGTPVLEPYLAGKRRR